VGTHKRVLYAMKPGYVFYYVFRSL
jgi:hypothetical protein